MSGKQNGLQIVDKKTSRVDQLKWVLVIVLLIAGIAANFYFSYVAWAIRTAIGIVWILLLIGIAATTSQGSQAWSFIKSARGELRKVVWPTRQETTQTTLVVAAMVIVTALILWGLDTFFFWAVSLVTG